MIFCIEPSGGVNAKLLDVVEPNSIEELKEQQTDALVKGADNDVLVTLLAIKILNDHFAEKFTLW